MVAVDDVIGDQKVLVQRQNALLGERWRGHADFLERVDRPSGLGSWSYEVADTKLARRVKPYFLVQLCFYSQLLERLQGTAPEWTHVVLGSKARESFRLAEFSAYYRRLQDRFLRVLEAGANGTYPDPVEHDFVVRDFKFASGESLPETRIHYATIGTPRPGNGVLVLHGTGRVHAKLNGYTSAGKTGTAQIFDPVTKHYSHNYNASFTGFAPVTNPALVVLETTAYGPVGPKAEAPGFDMVIQAFSGLDHRAGGEGRVPLCSRSPMVGM